MAGPAPATTSPAHLSFSLWGGGGGQRLQQGWQVGGVIIVISQTVSGRQRQRGSVLFSAGTKTFGRRNE